MMRVDNDTLHHWPTHPLRNTSSCHLLTRTATADPPLHEGLSILGRECQLLIPGKPHHLAESVLELWWAMEPLVTFTEEEALAATMPSN